MKIALTSVHVDDPAAAHAFYTEKLGFISRMFMPEAQMAIVASPEEPDSTGLLLEPSDNPIVKPYRDGLRASGIPSIVFGVPDVRAEYERLRALGVTFTQEPQTAEWGTTAIFDDTCGNFIQLFQQ
jgi:predicted enzyme related to lactoylglutathione lyase